MELKVVKNDGEVAEFTDGSKVVRQRPDCSTATGIRYSKMIQWDEFKVAFEKGLSETEVNQRLSNTDTSDGLPIGTNLTHPQIGVCDKGFNKSLSESALRQKPEITTPFPIHIDEARFEWDVENEGLNISNKDGVLLMFVSPTFLSMLLNNTRPDLENNNVLRILSEKMRELRPI